MKGKNMKHPHAELMIAYANDTSLEIECFNIPSNSWFYVECPRWLPDMQYRIKPKEQKMLFIVGPDGVSRSYPEPVKEALQFNTVYFVPVVGAPALAHSYTWTDHTTDNSSLGLGLIHLTREAAVLHAKAMLGID